MACLGLAAGSPAKAQLQTCTAFFESQLEAEGFACQIGDKIYDQFNFNGLTSPGTSVFAFTETGTQHTLSGAGLNATSGFTYSYRMRVATPSPFLLYQYVTDAAGSAGAGSFSKTLTAAGQGTSTFNSGGGLANIVTFSVATQESTFTGTVTVANGGRVDTITDSLSQILPSDVPVPGPLPIVGAGVAFGMSRRLRSRIARSV